MDGWAQSCTGQAMPFSRDGGEHTFGGAKGASCGHLHGAVQAGSCAKHLSTRAFSQWMTRSGTRATIRSRTQRIAASSGV